MEKIELTRAEIDALTKHERKIRTDLIQRIFTEVEEMLQGAIKSEDIKADFGAAVDRSSHLYAKRLCQTLVADLRIIKGEYKE